jgi:hypothetical protein
MYPPPHMTCICVQAHPRTTCALVEALVPVLATIARFFVPHTPPPPPPLPNTHTHTPVSSPDSHSCSQTFWRICTVTHAFCFCSTYVHALSLSPSQNPHSPLTILFDPPPPIILIYSIIIHSPLTVVLLQTPHSPLTIVLFALKYEMVVHQARTSIGTQVQDGP